MNLSDRLTKIAMKFSLDQQIEEVEREINMRESVYPGWIARGKIRRSAAEYHMDRMRAVLETLKGLKDGAKKQ